MDQESITFSKNRDKSYTMTDLHILGYNISFCSFNKFAI